MASITDVLYDASGLVPLDTASVVVYTALSQPAPPLTNSDGSAKSPVGSPVTSTTTNTFGQFALVGLAAGTPYHLYVVPGDGSAAYWMLYRVADPLVVVAPCVLYGALATPNGLPDAQIVYGFLEREAVITGGLALTTDSVSAPVSPEGTFTLPLWPTAALTPPALCRVQIGSALYRGSIPSQASIALDAWIALSTTQRLA
jgi:hypothetical protein